ncbi:putative camp-dependent protein kinase a [Erysiphe necator]|uniref:cAMP-dependent protein kinase n=1 Tax=Uncinula necator TaxID=52586 RepID=A0A0B1P4X5_UNCNE|nr:putative camp-dependent protein kinase a [Erysiphe necator]
MKFTSNVRAIYSFAREKAFMSHHSDNGRPMTMVDILQASKKRHLRKCYKGKLGIQDFILIKILGTGTFARVWLVKLAHPAKEDQDKVYALKVLRKVDVIRLKQVDHVNNERKILADLAGYPFIVNLITSFSDRESLYMLLDYCPGGEVFSHLRKAKRFDEDCVRFYAAEIVLILEYLHESRGVAYRDLKPENILLDEEGHVKLVDFGFGKFIGHRETYTLCGTPEYIAPEVIQSKGHTTAVDWWSFGILLFEFLTGYPPFWHKSNPLDVYKQILNNPIIFPVDVDLSPEAKDIILQLCTVDRTKRLGNIVGGAARVKSHPFFRGVKWENIYVRKCSGPIIPVIRFSGDTQYFDHYPVDKYKKEPYSIDLERKWEHHFKGF